jgi:hypothetical protein
MVLDWYKGVTQNNKLARMAVVLVGCPIVDREAARTCPRRVMEGVGCCWLFFFF